ncbi:MAG: PilZ protein [Alphaproteobacteria bacterium]|nr:PilZ protein [Alphaproteobacteria bacterium]
MGVERFIDGQATGQRRTKRARVLLAARLETHDGDIDARLRDLSQRGALVECREIPVVGSEVVFTRNTISVPARVAWTAGNRVGLEFAYAIDESEVLVQLRRTQVDQNPPRFRRPRLFGEDMTPQERQVVRSWGAAVGINLPGE